MELARVQQKHLRWNGDVLSTPEEVGEYK